MATTSGISFEDIQKTLRDSFYVTVGLGVIAFQKAQVQRAELRKQVEAGVTDLETALTDSFKTVEERLEAVEERIDAVLDDVEARLPEQARTTLSQARGAAKDARTQLRALIGPR